VFAVILLGIGIYYHFRIISPIALGDAVGAYYHDSHPQVTFTATKTDNSNEPMYLIKLRGNFQTDHFHTKTITFSVLANGTYLWALTAMHANSVIYNFPSVPSYWGDFVFTPLSLSVNWGE
jgi:hypothetical protein